MGDVVGALRGDLGDLIGDEVTGIDEPAVLFDGLEMLPGLLRQLVGEILDEPRPARRVENPADV